MASIFARHAFGALRRAPAAHLPRCIHTTPVVLKKKGKVEIDDLFGEDAFSQADDLIPTAPTTPAPSTSEATDATPTPETKTRKAPLTPAVRRARFEAQLAYAEPRIGRTPTLKKERLRKRHFLTLLDLAQSEADVRKVVELVPRYKAAGGELTASFAEELARRCQELQCQPLALEVFGDFAKYDVRLDLPAARWLVHSLYARYPLEQVLVATELYPIYGLPPVSADLASAAMLAAACYRAGTPEAVKAAEALQPAIQEMLKTTSLGTAPDHATRKQHKWIAWALRKVNAARKELKEKEPFVAPNALPLKIELQPPAKKKQAPRPKAKRALAA